MLRFRYKIFVSYLEVPDYIKYFTINDILKWLKRVKIFLCWNNRWYSYLQLCSLLAATYCHCETQSLFKFITTNHTCIDATVFVIILIANQISIWAVKNLFWNIFILLISKTKLHCAYGNQFCFGNAAELHGNVLFWNINRIINSISLCDFKL